MRKLALFMAIILVVATPLSVSAAPRLLNVFPALSFDGTTATCQATVAGNNTSEHIEVTMKLMQGSYCEATWTADGYGYVYMLEYDTVTKGRTYNLVVEVKVNGIAQTPASVSATC